MKNSTAIVITSISDQNNPVLAKVAAQCRISELEFYMVGDVTTPEGFSIPGCRYMDIPFQKSMQSELASMLPTRVYARKNLGYLQAMRDGATIILETDDDNHPLRDFWKKRDIMVRGSVVNGGEWTNVYQYFTNKKIWPRGYPVSEYKIAEAHNSNIAEYFCPIQQGLVNGNPDVDAIYRMTGKLPVDFEERDPVILAKNSCCPFNSQNTAWFREAFLLLYLPAFTSFRMTDIWRSFIAQRIIWTCGWNISFHSASVRQLRNEHNLSHDFELESAGYLHNRAIMSVLRQLPLKQGEKAMPENMRMCYKALIDADFMDKKELALVDAWIHDVQNLR